MFKLLGSKPEPPCGLGIYVLYHSPALITCCDQVHQMPITMYMFSHAQEHTVRIACSIIISEMTAVWHLFAEHPTFDRRSSPGSSQRPQKLWYQWICLFKPVRKACHFVLNKDSNRISEKYSKQSTFMIRKQTASLEQTKWRVKFVGKLFQM